METNKPIVYDQVFVRHYKKRVLPHTKLHKHYKNMIALFIKDHYHPRLKNHKLKGKLNEYRAFFIDEDCRVIYVEIPTSILFLDIGKHDEVYR